MFQIAIALGGKLWIGSSRPCINQAYHSSCKDESINLAVCVGYNATPTWYSPGAATLQQRCADLEILREAEDKGDLALSANSWLSGLVDHVGILVRKKLPGSPWLFSLGALSPAWRRWGGRRSQWPC